MNNDFNKRYLEARRKVIETDFAGLNPMQRKAVMATEGALLILAGAGSGKTTVLINRIANLMRYGKAGDSEEIPENAGIEDIDAMARLDDEARRTAAFEPVEPWRILAITFTNKAADELKTRLSKMLGEAGADVWASTFHSACVRILRRDADRLGFTSSFTIYDSSDSQSLIKHILRDFDLDDKKYPPRMLLSEISRAKDDCCSPEQYYARAKATGDARRVKIAEIYAEYSRRAFAAGAMDFDDLIYYTVKLLNENEDVCQYWQKRFKYILIDEYQDTNKLQYMLASKLAEGWGNICVVGDDDQSIYKFRGATITNILEFEGQYKNATTIRLEQNYRSTQNILSAANELIRNNARRKGKELWTDNGDGAKIRFHRSDTQEGEAEYVARMITEGVADGKHFSDYAILYRNHVLSNSIESAFKRNGVPYRIVSGLRFFDRAEVKDMLAYLWVIANPTDNLRLRRIINVPARKIGNKTVETAAMLAELNNTTMFDIVSHAAEHPELGRATNALTKFAELITNLQKMKEHMPLDEFYEQVMVQTGYLEALKAKETQEAQGRIENTMELKSNIADFMSRQEQPTLEGFLEEVSLFTDIDRMDESSDAVVMMTMHSAKGLEFPQVFLVGMEEGIFPGFRAMEKEEDLEEERRLCYVAVTRAKQQLYLTCAERRMMYGRTQYSKPSQFLKEIPKQFVDSNISETRQEMQEKLDLQPNPKYQSSRAYDISGAHKKQPVIAKKKTAQTVAAPALKPGDQVDHKAFGHGMITSCKPMGGDILLEITFDKVGTKRLMAKSAMNFMTKE